jgi:acyl-[acyl-carrier-protein] desaturase
MSSTIEQREKVYRAYMEFFENAEKRRRWTIFDDIPWDKLDPSKNDENRALCAETFCGVEMYLPDYVAGGINLLRQSFGQAWFQANWAYEESKHALSLREYLVRSGQRSFAQMDAFERAILGQQWKLPFETPRRMTCYGAIQEGATWLIYRKQLEVAREAGDEVLATIYDLASRDEAAHAGFYRTILKLELEEDREGTLLDLAYVFGRFQMPGVGLVPDYDARILIMRDAGIDRTVFLTRVWFPMLKQLGTSRREMSLALRKNREPGGLDALADQETANAAEA